MKNILLVCSAGMSTTVLVTKMEESAKNKNFEYKINALPLTDIAKLINDVDVILLGPQVRFQKPEIEKMISKSSNQNVPVDIIDIRDYGTMNGENVLNKAIELIGE